MKYNLKRYGEFDDREHPDLSPEQLWAAEILATPGRAGMSLEMIAEELGTTPRTINRWRRQAAFSEYVKRRTMENVAEHLPDVMQTLTEKANFSKGDKGNE